VTNARSTPERELQELGSNHKIVTASKSEAIQTWGLAAVAESGSFRCLFSWGDMTDKWSRTWLTGATDARPVLGVKAKPADAGASRP
jgi:hypothetical protein